ncbi:MAG: hypothetical protein A2X22_03095 [Bacteroidetes bacterium GWF2_49_14]|nr:MAG: hypothetical protein A2X22_03095 [Bacteroidetes bacterium GWF2_49_14]
MNLKTIIMKYLAPIVCMILLAGCQPKEAPFTHDQVDQAWKEGTTLKLTVFENLSGLFTRQPVKDDKGYNVLVDLAHECSFYLMWTLPEQLNKLGYRSLGSHATMSSAMDPKGESRVRILWDTVNKVYPFVWWPNPKYHVAITGQFNPKAQDYTDAEITALVNFVKKGGGLIIQTDNRKLKGGPGKPGVADSSWSVRKLVQAFNAEVADDPVKLTFGKGRVLITGNTKDLKYPRNATDVQKDSVDLVVDGYLAWLTEKQKRLKDEPIMPQTMEGGGPIYPELEENFSNIVFYYAANQKTELLNVVKNDVPKAQTFIQERLPSTPTAEPMYLILCAGGGGGWAVNIYKPKENGIISLDGHGILSIFGHELAHTMYGPANDEGNVAGITPIPNRGEAHAGWFQGKVNALFDSTLRDKANRDCNLMFAFDPKGNAMDLATCYENEAMNKQWGYGKDWHKTWYIWQKLDDRYGPGWYPKWKYVQHTRWKSDPEHRLTWDEMIEDMSIAVGEDLFPFFIKLGTTLDKKRLEQIDYNGATIKLPVAPIEVTMAGAVRIEAI